MMRTAGSLGRDRTSRRGVRRGNPGAAPTLRLRGLQKAPSFLCLFVLLIFFDFLFGLICRCFGWVSTSRDVDVNWGRLKKGNWLR